MKIKRNVCDELEPLLVYLDESNEYLDELHKFNSSHKSFDLLIIFM